MERVSAISRNDIDRVYRDNALFMVVNHICLPYAPTFTHLRLLPEEVFQQVMAWLDKISREEDDDEVRALIGNVWYEQSLDFAGMTTEASDFEVSRATGLVMIFLLTCLIKLGCNPSGEGDFYASLSDLVMEQGMNNMAGFQKMARQITNHPYYLKHNEEVNRWLGEYMLKSPVTFTDRDGRLKTSITKAGKQKGRKKPILFRDANKEKDEPLTQYWATLFVEYLAYRQRSGVSIDSKKDNIVIRSIHAFKQYWIDEEGLMLPDAGSAYLSFLTDDCGLPIGENENHESIKPSTISDKLTPLLRIRLDEMNGDLGKVREFLSLRKMQ